MTDLGSFTRLRVTMKITQYFSRVRVAVSDNRIKESIQEEMKEIRDRWGEEFTDGGEPQILFNNKTHEIWVSAGDWHGRKLVREIFDELGELAGVMGIDGESESYPEGYHYGEGDSDWEKIYPVQGRVAAKEKPAVSRERALKVMKDLGVSLQKFSPDQFRMGLGVEREHDEVTHADMVKVGHIVLDHLREDPEYYTKLKKVMGNF
jgi:hypothetical protein